MRRRGNGDAGLVIVGNLYHTRVCLPGFTPQGNNPKLNSIDMSGPPSPTNAYGRQNHLRIVAWRALVFETASHTVSSTSFEQA